MSTSRSVALLSSAAIVFSSLVAVAPAASADDKPESAPEVTSAVAHDTSPPLRELAKTSPSAPSLTDRPVTINRPVPDDRIDVINAGNPGPPVIPDPTGPGTEDMPALASSFDGLTNVNGYYPPDTDGDVGPNHYVQMVNASFQIFNKTGTSLGRV